MQPPDLQVNLVAAQDEALVGRQPSSLLEDATRQLSICNACRYCEGFCAVFPALTRRTELGDGDVTQLANLCHDCRACFDACMYSPPHEFEVNIPRALTAVRLEDYRGYVWPARVPAPLSGWIGVGIGSVIAAVLIFVIAVIHVGVAGLVHSTGGAESPYDLIPYSALLALMLGAAAFAVLIMVEAGRRYWRAVGPPLDSGAGRVVWRAVWQALTLTNLRGGGEDCYYPDDEQPSPWRRRWHSLVVYGFSLCFLSTVAAAFSQDMLGSDPPYPWLSVPVISGTAGGVAMLIGCVGLIALKARSSPVTSMAEMTVKDYGLLGALSFLALSGLLVLTTRTTPVYGIALLIHLSALVETFAMMPYSKLVHAVFRVLALVRDNLELAARSAC